MAAITKDDGKIKIELSLGLFGALFTFITAIVTVAIAITSRPDKAEVKQMIEDKTQYIVKAQAETQESIKLIISNQEAFYGRIISELHNTEAKNGKK